MTAIIALKPDTHYNPIDLDRFISELEIRFQQKEVMHSQDAADFLGIAKNTLYKAKGLPSHKIEGLGIVYLRSELIEFIKRH